MGVYEDIVNQRREMMKSNRRPSSIEVGAAELRELAQALGVEMGPIEQPTERMWAGWFPVSRKPNEFPIYVVPQSGVRVLDEYGDA